MSEEEKKAYEELKKEINKPLEVPEDKCNTFILYNIDNAKIISNLIEKQQKEIDLCEETEIALNNRIMDLEEINKEHQKLNGELRDEIKRQGNTREIEEKYIEENFISKDKIRDKIEELNKESKDLIKKGNFESRNDGFEATDIEGLNDLINYQSKGIIIKILKELLKEE